MRIYYRAPDVTGDSPIIDIERIGTVAADQEIGTAAAVKHIVATFDRDGVITAAREGINQLSLDTLMFKLSGVIFSKFVLATRQLGRCKIVGVAATHPPVIRSATQNRRWADHSA